MIKRKQSLHDEAYKLLFSEPKLVQDLLTGFFAEDWVKDLDFSTLQHLNSEYITELLNERASDTVWKVQWQGQPLYLLLLIEFQSSIDPFMVVRVLTYIGLLYQDIIKQDAQVRGSKQLPPILPLILYNGPQPWSAPLNFAGLLSPHLPKAIRRYQPDLSIWLLDEGRYTINKEHMDPNNLVAPLVRLEQSKQVADVLSVVNFLMRRLKGAEFDSIRRAFTVYLKRMLRFQKMLPELKLNELQEVQQMLSERVDIWMQEAAEKGMAQGMAQGLSKGITQGISQGITQGISQGERAVIRRQLFKRFGTLTAEQELLLKNKSADELLEISELILDAQSIDDVLGCARH